MSSSNDRHDQLARRSYDAVVIGSGPNGLAAAITLAEKQRSVLVLEAEPTIGGGTRSVEMTLPGFLHDVCSAIHPLGIVSPFFKSLSLADLGVERARYTDGTLAARSAITGEIVAHVKQTGAADAVSAIEKAHSAFLEWRMVPAPKRGELVRLLGAELRASKQALGRLVCIEVGKITSEGLGEVQEAFAAGARRTGLKVIVFSPLPVLSSVR